MTEPSSLSERERGRRDIYFDQVIEAAYLHTKPGCFYIGPFARRVSFASQQQRALDLVAALADRGKLRHKNGGAAKTVAVIGAGIAGITAMAALRGQGCAVHLYEASDRPLKLQELAEHRLIHPNISRWPAGKLELTTEFACMDWYAAPSDQVIRSFQREWERWLKPKNGDSSCLFISGVEVSDLSSDDDVVRLRRNAAAGVNLPDNRYDYAFVTTGFAEEDKFADADFVSYWNWSDDKVEAWRADQRNVYISGCGDGGMIEALRLVHEDFDRGWLAVRLAHALGDWKTKEIIDAENQALMAAKSLACMNLSGSRQDDAVGVSARKVGAKFEDDEIVRRLGKFYSDIVAELPRTALDILDRSLDVANVEHGRVTMISRQLGPFGPYSAPIHKLMVAHAIGKSRLRYRQGELLEADGSVHIHWIREDDVLHLADTDGLIIRHGSPANLAGLASRAESESLRIRQFMIADYIDPGFERALPAPSGYPTRDKQAGRFAGSRLEMARGLVDAILPGARVDAVDLARPGNAGTGAGESAHCFIYIAPQIPPAGRKPTFVEMPGRVFGINLVPGEPAALGALL